MAYFLGGQYSGGLFSQVAHFLGGLFSGGPFSGGLFSGDLFSGGLYSLHPGWPASLPFRQTDFYHLELYHLLFGALSAQGLGLAYIH